MSVFHFKNAQADYLGGQIGHMDALEELKDLKASVKDALGHLRVSALSGAADIAKWIFAALLTINSGALLAFAENKSVDSTGLILFVVGIVSAVISGFVFWITLVSAAFVVLQSENLARQILLSSLITPSLKQKHAKGGPLDGQAEFLGETLGYALVLMIAGAIAWIASLSCFVIGTLICIS